MHKLVCSSCHKCIPNINVFRHAVNIVLFDTQMDLTSLFSEIIYLHAFPMTEFLTIIFKSYI